MPCRYPEIREAVHVCSLSRPKKVEENSSHEHIPHSGLRNRTPIFRFVFSLRHFYCLYMYSAYANVIIFKSTREIDPPLNHINLLYAPHLPLYKDACFFRSKLAC